jgi:hypothetical protein
VLRFVAVIVALGITAPVESVTLPTMAARDSCVHAGAQRAKAIMNSLRQRMFFLSLSTVRASPAMHGE